MELQAFYQHLIGKVEHSLFHLEASCDPEHESHISLCQFSLKLLNQSKFLSFYAKDHYSLLALPELDQIFLSNYKNGELNLIISLERIEGTSVEMDFCINSARKKSNLSFSSLIIEKPGIPSGLYQIIAQLLFLPQEPEAEALFLFQDMDVLRIFNCTAVKK